MGMKSICHVICFVVALAGAALAAPQPAVVQKTGDWTINATFEQPQQILLRSGVDDKPVRFWYLIMTLTNKTGQDADFYPQCDLVTDTFQVTPAGRGVTPPVFELIKKRHVDRYPFLESLEGAGNKILEGQDNAKDVAVIWPDFDMRAGSINVFITGLSNETAVVGHPVAKDEQGRPTKVFLRKTLELSYKLRGDPALRSSVEVVYQGQRWVMR
jgi:hypothetical protein